MFQKSKPGPEGLFKGILAAYAILVLHLLLIAGLGLIVIFLTGVAHYLFWIVLGGMASLGLSAYLFFRRLRREGKTLGEALRSPAFSGREVEVSLLGGMATMRLGSPDRPKPHPIGCSDDLTRIEDAQTRNIHEIRVLADLLEKNLITREEFDQAKNRLLH